MHLPSSPQPQSPSSQNVTVDPTQLKVVVQPESRPPPLFRGDQSETFSVHEWEDMMKSYMNRAACSDSERSELIMSRLAGRARDVVKVSLRSCPRVSPAELPTTIVDILKRNFSEITFSSVPMKDFYGTMPRDSESAMDYWIRLNKAIDVADECLRRRGKGVEDPSAEVVMMFICHCPDPSLAVYFQFKPVELWTAAEVQERLDGHVRSLRSTAARAQHAVNISTCTHESTVPAPHCGMQHQLPVVVTPPLVPPTPATACAPVPSQPQQLPGWAAQSLSSPPVPTADVNIQQVAALFDKGLCRSQCGLSDPPTASPRSAGDPVQLLKDCGLADINVDGCEVSESCRRKLAELVLSYQDVFSRDKLDCGEAKEFVHRIHLSDDRPFCLPYRRVPPGHYQQLREVLSDMEMKGIISKSLSEYASPLVMVWKNNGDLRICTDFRWLNAKTIKDAHPLPHQADCLAALGGNALFSTMDLTSGFYNVPLHESDRKFTAFTTPMGLYEYNRLP
ncbi:hypothetical protein AAFF_G00317690 [Aldrovandia affinis]|uniref:ribonuclease H n=1 Tax=Aldrovandia affinis TaxID=143900 RepID=A0AAD7W0I0_9TELE|nr:hypothetical protein AAFF_G00317690 [Aldrovandia affinis]